jgi:hypothetical protein
MMDIFKVSWFIECVPLDQKWTLIVEKKPYGFLLVLLAPL